MNSQYITDEWQVIEEGFDPQMHEASESIFSLGNGHMGQRANFEEKYSGETLQGTYIAGIYYPDKTRVGWWKNGYPEYFAKVLNAPNWTGIHVRVNQEELDLHTCKPIEFRRMLDMKHGFLERTFLATLPSGIQVRVNSKRFLSMDENEIGAIRYAVQPVGSKANIEILTFIDGDVKNRDANYDEKFWDILDTRSDPGFIALLARTRKSNFAVAFAACHDFVLNGKPLKQPTLQVQNPFLAGHRFGTVLEPGDELVVYKFVSVADSLNHEPETLLNHAQIAAQRAQEKGFNTLFAAHAGHWEESWSHSDIVIKDDPAAQQGIRFNIFHLNQTYTGTDERLNIGPKGFTGEKYGGSTYWDTEAFLIPFYLSTEPGKVARNLLIYRYKHLDKAIENAARLGFHNGAALFPMVTMNGEECHNEWEITFEEIHRNGAIAYAIFNYIRYTGDDSYLAEGGLEVLIALSRFWSQRVNWSQPKQKYVILGVTGPNEYENNVNNNWYTNKMAEWTLRFTLESAEEIRLRQPETFRRISEKTGLQWTEESARWKDIMAKIFLPVFEPEGIFLQQEGFMDKEQRLATNLDPAERPINQHWSWDRILRSVFIKQADVLQGLFWFEDEYPVETIRRNFNFYEPRTVHESSLSPCIHSILANRIGESAKAYELYLRTSRLDLDDYNREVAEGLHITSMGGTWMSVVQGFGGMKIKNGMLSLNPALPANWTFLSFCIHFRERILKVIIEKNTAEVILLKGDPLQVIVNDSPVSCIPQKST